jgi:hypothetical protein
VQGQIQAPVQQNDDNNNNLKDTLILGKLKRQPREWEQISLNHTSDNELNSK